ncbi:hypothetical protein Q0M94_27450 (plasmid) [Deinococcus radiomollis]|uniref:hypothetical protein n=1 Tax=Deinococcus radiomollis TaxID=468916 RepID=UPI003891D6AD
MQKTTHLGKRRKIIDGLEKVTGSAQYTADLSLAGMVHARPVFSLYPHARVAAIDAGAALALPGVIAVLTGHDLNHGRVAHSRPNMLLALDEVIFAGQPVAVVVADSEATATDAAALLDIDYDVLESVDDAVQAMTDELLVWPQGVPSAGASMASLHGGEAGAGTGAKLSNIDERRVTERETLSPHWKAPTS